MEHILGYASTAAAVAAAPAALATPDAASAAVTSTDFAATVAFAAVAHADAATGATDNRVGVCACTVKPPPRGGFFGVFHRQAGRLNPSHVHLAKDKKWDELFTALEWRKAGANDFNEVVHSPAFSTPTFDITGHVRWSATHVSTD